MNMLAMQITLRPLQVLRPFPDAVYRLLIVPKVEEINKFLTFGMI